MQILSSSPKSLPWSCPHVQRFWDLIDTQIHSIFKRSLQLGAKMCILGLSDEIPLDPQNRDLLHILLYSAQKCILSRWIEEDPPTLNQWLCTVLDIIPLEAFLTAMKDKPFYRIWNPFFDYLGTSKSNRLGPAGPCLD